MSANILHFLTETARKYSVKPVAVGDALYQDAGINGADFSDFIGEIERQYRVPAFDPERFADTSEPPRGMTLLGRVRILQRERLTCAHLARVIEAGRWIEP